MKNNIRRIMATVMTVALLLTVAPLNGFVGLKLNLGWLNFSEKASAEEDELAPTGQCGENVYWTFDSTTGFLTISGSGNMYSYDYYDYDYSNDSPFYNNNSIKIVVIEDGVTSIGSETFYMCTGLTSITIPDSVISIGEYAFIGCTGLTSITIPDSVISIGSNTFYRCTGLTSITIPDNVTSIDSCTFCYCIGLTSITIPNSVTSIGVAAFGYCTGLTSIAIPDSVTIIDEGAFNNCTGLTSATIPNSVTSIGCDAFGNCTNLKRLNYNTINCNSGSGAFWGSGIETITVSSNVESIPDGLFRNMPDLTNVIFESDDYIKMGNTVFDSSYNAVICCKENSYMHHYAKEQGLKYCIIDDDSNPSFTVKNDVLSKYSGSDSNLFVSCASEIGYGAFADNKNVQTIELSGNVTRIYNKAFANCSNLEKIIIPQSVASIGDNAFSGCSKLTIWCYAGSYAESYAKAHNIKIQYITLQIAESVVSLKSDESVVLNASYSTVLLDEDELIWTSSDPSVVTVTSDGKITAVGNGEATITATSKTGLYATCVVKVSKDTPQVEPKVKSVKIDDVSLNYKKSTTLKPTVDADSGVKYTVKYESSNPKVATVDDNGKVTATKRGKGTATITCTVNDEFGNTVKDTCNVNVSLTFGQKLIVYVLFGWIWY